MLHRMEAGDVHASADLLPLVYDELRRLAARELENESPAHTLQPTALVHEAYLRLVGSETSPQWRHEGHFFAAAAQAMRRILVDHARSKQTTKRGGDRPRVPLDPEEAALPQRRSDLLALDEALSRLAENRPEIVELVTLRYFGGLTMEQAAAAVDIPLRTAQRHWTYARAWLLRELIDEDSD
jgi:RNA polymerase sigma factor (TIGR02999 family)